jgi:hypothetical protein
MAMEEINGFGMHSAEQFEENMTELNKALGTGQDGDAYGNGAYADMSAIRPQSLEGTMKVVTAQEKHIKFWKRIGKKQAFNTVEEFNVLDSYGGDSSPFFVEGGLPGEEDSNFVRQAQYVKFLGTTRVITHPATLVKNTMGDIVAQQSQAGTLWLLTQIERQLYFADSALDSLAFDGVIAQVRNAVQGKSYANQHIIDMRGEVVDENTLEDMATIIADNYGGSNLEFHMTNQVKKDFTKLVTGAGGRQRLVGTGGAPIDLGQPVGGYEANAGNIEFIGNTFLKPQGKPRDASQKGAPAIPAIAADQTANVKLAGVADATSKLDAGTYFYFVSAKNSAGESAPLALGSVATTAGQRVDIKFNRVVSDPTARTYKVYRGVTSNPENALFAFELKDDSTQGVVQTIADRNFDIPGTDTAVLIDNDSENVLCFKQLAPLMKLPLARISASERFMILLYGMMQVYNPRRVIIVKNIGKLGINSNRPLFGNVYDQPSFGTVKPVLR